MIFETDVEFLGEDRPCVIEWRWIDGEIFVERVEISLILEHQWTPRGELRTWRERFFVDVKTILSNGQISDFAREIKAEQVKAVVDNYDDGRMLDWEWSNRSLRAA